MEVHCKVTMRNPRTAFETNASTSNLATLNQNKFIQYANGLVNKTRGFNTTYKFATATNTTRMKPTSLEVIDESFLKKVISAMYGTDPSNWLKLNWNDGATCSMMNLPMQFPCYYTLYANNTMNSGQYGW